jgi:hypothetical protein
MDHILYSKVVTNHVYGVKERDMSTPHKRKQIIADRQKLTSTCNDYGISFVYDINNNDGRKSTIHDLDLA